MICRFISGYNESVVRLVTKVYNSSAGIVLVEFGDRLKLVCGDLF